MPQSTKISWILGVSIALFMTLTPFLYYRYEYTTSKRLRVVEDGKLYRSGSLTVAGFEDAIKRYGIKTVLNLQEEAEDPNLPIHACSSATERESKMCERLGVNYEIMFVDLQPNPSAEPEAIGKFLSFMSDTKKHPVLLHCRAGLHRTGVLVAMYRIQEYKWTPYEALGELRGLGFGRFNSYADNEYIRQYITEFQPRGRGTPGRLVSRPSKNYVVESTGTFP